MRATVAAAVLCAALALLLPLPVLQLLFAAPLTLLLPGYAITAAAFAPRRLEPPRLLLLSVALSLMVLTLGSLALDYLPGGVRDWSWAVLLVLVVLAGCRIAAVRRGSQSPRRLVRELRPRIPPLPALLGTAAAAAAAGAIVLAFLTLPAKNAIGYTELWMLPRADGAPGVRVGVTSQEKGRRQYRLRLVFANRARPIERDISLAPGESTVMRFDTTPLESGKDVRVNAALFLRDRPGDVYRRVAGWVPAARSSG